MGQGPDRKTNSCLDISTKRTEDRESSKQGVGLEMREGITKSTETAGAELGDERKEVRKLPQVQCLAALRRSPASWDLDPRRGAAARAGPQGTQAGHRGVGAQSQKCGCCSAGTETPEKDH